jgi:hypothetical protein
VWITRREIRLKFTSVEGNLIDSYEDEPLRLIFNTNGPTNASKFSTEGPQSRWREGLPDGARGHFYCASTGTFLTSASEGFRVDTRTFGWQTPVCVDEKGRLP